MSSNIWNSFQTSLANPTFPYNILRRGTDRRGHCLHNHQLHVLANGETRSGSGSQGSEYGRGDKRANGETRSSSGGQGSEYGEETEGTDA
jgi:hypothetical protein